MMEIINGTVEAITYRNEENGYSVFGISTDGGDITAVGVLPYINIGEQVSLSGEFTVHATYGKQFKVEKCERSLPESTASILRYLSLGAVKGIGPATARNIVACFGGRSLKIIAEQPDELERVKGISPRRAALISEDFNKQFGLREVMLRLSELDITAAESMRIYKKYGGAAVERVLENPYRLAREGIGISFTRADEIAQNSENSVPREYRINAGIEYVLFHNLQNGHTCLPQDKLVATAAKMLGCEEDEVQRLLCGLLNSHALFEYTVDENSFIFLPHMYHAERYCANRIALMLKVPPKEIPILKGRLEQFEEDNGIIYGSLQRKAISSALTNGLVIMTGGPGTGKTTTLNAIISLLKEAGCKIALAAPTGRAAKRMSELTGTEAKTIHRMLEVEWDSDERQTFRRNEQNPLSEDVIVVDELSMMDIGLFDALLKAMSVNCRLIMVGDVDQLPSVGAGNVLGDIIESKTVPVIRLDRVFRQSNQSYIVTNAHRIIDGEMPEFPKQDTDFFLVNSSEPSQLTAQLFAERIGKAYGFSKNEIQVLCPSRKSYLGTINLNNALQQRVNAADKTKRELPCRSYTLREGDKVMQVKNNYDVVWHADDGSSGSGIYNGDIGTLLKIDRSSGAVTVRFDDKTAEFNGEEALELELAYAVTVHKSQGNEFDCVILPIGSTPPQLCYRNLLYTAVTRAKKLLVVIGTKNDLKRMIDNNKKTLRYTAFARMLDSAVHGE